MGWTKGTGTPSPEQQRDALEELANVVCGNLLPAWRAPRRSSRLTRPEIAEAKVLEGTDQARPVARTRLTLDEGRAELALFITGDLPAPVANQEARK